MTPPTDPAGVRAAFDRGVAAALDPANAAAVTGGIAVTTRASAWVFDLCPVCRHTFRPGDRVKVEPDRTVRHASPALPCAEGGTVPATDTAAVAAFFDGLNAAWPLPDEGLARPVRLTPGHWLLADPLAGFGRYRCTVCTHTFRPNEQVVICPCQAIGTGRPIAPCRAAIHRDRVQGLNCWETWNPGESRQHCPITHRRLAADG